MALNNTNKMTMVMRINHKIESLTACYGISIYPTYSLFLFPYKGLGTLLAGHSLITKHGNSYINQILGCCGL